MKLRSRKSGIDRATNGRPGRMATTVGVCGTELAEGAAGGVAAFKMTSMAFLAPPRTVNSRSSVMNPERSHRTRYNPSLRFGMTVVPSAPVLKDSDHRDTPMFRMVPPRNEALTRNWHPGWLAAGGLYYRVGCGKRNPRARQIRALSCSSLRVAPCVGLFPQVRFGWSLPPRPNLR